MDARKDESTPTRVLANKRTNQLAQTNCYTQQDHHRIGRLDRTHGAAPRAVELAQDTAATRKPTNSEGTTEEDQHYKLTVNTDDDLQQATSTDASDDQQVWEDWCLEAIFLINNNNNHLEEYRNKVVNLHAIKS